MNCAKNLVCLAPTHELACPWHDANVNSLRISAREWDRLMAELDKPPVDKPRLREMLAEDDPFE